MARRSDSARNRLRRVTSRPNDSKKTTFTRSNASELPQPPVDICGFLSFPRPAKLVMDTKLLS
jgi:hypothetical protein